MRASVTAERAGIPTVSVVTSAFMIVQRMITKAFGVSLPVAEIPHGLAHGAETALIVDRIVAALEQQPQALKKNETPAPKDTVFSGTTAGVMEEFPARLWTDGLPIIPPTRERVEAFLRFTDRNPDEEL